VLEARRSSETSVHTRSTRRHIPEDSILHSHRRENPKSYIIITYSYIIWFSECDGGSISLLSDPSQSYHLLDCLLYFEKKNERRLMKPCCLCIRSCLSPIFVYSPIIFVTRSPCCLCVCVFLNFC
jgi:hypothetical protein